MTFPLLLLVFSPPLSGRSNLPDSPVAAFWKPPPGELWLSFVCHSWRNDLETCERADIVEKQPCAETSSSCSALGFSWPIIKTLLKYQCPERNEHTSPPKWAKDIKEIWSCWRFYNWVKKGLMLMWFKAALPRSNVSGLEYTQPGLKTTFCACRRIFPLMLCGNRILRTTRGRFPKQVFAFDPKRSALKHLRLLPVRDLCLFRRPRKADLVSVACSFAAAKHKHVPPNEAAELPAQHSTALHSAPLILYCSYHGLLGYSQHAFFIGIILNYFYAPLIFHIVSMFCLNI